MGLFQRHEPACTLGAATVALRVPAGSALASGCVAVVCGQHGGTRRVAPGVRASLAKGESMFCFHPGPYSVDLVPFAAAPEAGLRVAFVVDTPDPRVAQQRFDLFLASEVGERLDLGALGAAIEDAVRRELAQGNLALPPCATMEEWDVFRAGLDELLYIRFGVTVEECMPADVGDYRAALMAPVVCAPAQPAAAIETHTAADDARALRRLFLELPRVTSALRLAPLPAGQDCFRQHQSLLRRLDHVALSVSTMPALELAAPGRRLDARQQARRARHSVHAARSLDDAWALLARIKTGSPQDVFDDADRIVANLEHDSAARRLAEGEVL